MKRRKNVILVEDRWWSHHPMWYRIILQYFFEKTDYNLGLICAFPENIKIWIEENYPQEMGRVEIQYLKYYQALNNRSHNRIYNFYLKLRPLMTFRKAINKMVKKMGGAPEFIFFGTVDDILHTCVPTKVCNKMFTYPWTGIYHRPVHVEAIVSGCSPDRVARVTAMESCLGIYHFQENFEEQMTRDFGVQMKYFPEFTDISQEDCESKIVSEILERAAGRKIIGVSGLLQPPKGIYTMHEVARHTQDEFFFAFIGNNDTPGGAEVMKSIKQRFAVDNLENVYSHYHYVESHAEFNKILKTFDLIWGAYENFPWGSNHLGKAASLKRPIIVSDSGVMGDRVKKYNMGITIREGSPLDAYLKIKDYFRSTDSKEHGFSCYWEDNCPEVAYRHFDNLRESYMHGRIY